MAKLQSVCLELKREDTKVPMDGNCMFSSLALQLNYTGTVADASSRVRTELVTYLRNHPDMVSYSQLITIVLF